MPSEKPILIKKTPTQAYTSSHSNPAAVVEQDKLRQNGANGGALHGPFKQEAEYPAKDSSLKPTFKKYWWLVPVLGVTLVIGGVTAMRLQENSTEEAATTETASLSVRTATAQQEPIRAWVSSEGTVRAAKYQHLTFEVEGDITYLAFSRWSQTARRRLC